MWVSVPASDAKGNMRVKVTKASASIAAEIGKASAIHSAKLTSILKVCAR
jgi:hypothetical protein